MKHFLHSCSLLALLSVSSHVYADQDANDALQPRAELSVKGGTDRSLMTTEFWAPLAQKRNQVLYVDARLMGDNDENNEGNLGFGYRQVVQDYVVGGHAWIDRRRTQNNSTFHQFTFGAERLGHIVDVRANGYVPLNNAKTVTTANGGGTAPYLAGSGIYYDTNGFLVETPQYGMDAEIGYRFPIFLKQMDTFRVYGGGYHFFRNNTDNVTGFRIRTEAQINQAISVGARFQYDAERGSQGFLEATLKFPFSAKKLYHKDYIRARLDESPERDVDIVTANKAVQGQKMVPVINTVTGLQQRVLYVDNTAQPNGDGTKDNPYNTLAAAEAALQANDVLYINHGDGTTTGMDQGIVINKANITLIGSGSNFVYDSGKFAAQNGINFSGTLLQAASLSPVITNTQAFVDDGTGNVTSLSGNGIFATQNNINISGITVSDASAGGIYVLAQTAGTVVDTVTISNVTVTGSKNGRGILVHASDGAIINNVNVTGNTANGSLGTGGVGIQIRARLAGSQINNVIVQDNITRNNSSVGNQVFATTDAHIGSVLLQGNTSSNNNSSGFGVQSSTNSTIDMVVIANNTSTNNTTSTSHGVSIQSSINSVISTVITRDNTFTGNVGFGISAQALTNGTLNNLIFERNNASGNTRSGITAVANDGTINSATLSDNTFNNNGTYGMNINSVTAASVLNNVSISRNSITGNTTNGIYLQKGVAGAVMNTDLGGGAYGSAGLNNISGNIGNDVRLNYIGGGNVIAQNNYWGGGALTRVELTASTTIDSTAFLTTAPNL